MPSIVRERMQALMDEQKAEASLPTSRAVYQGDEQEIDEPVVQEPDESAAEMSLPEQAPEEADDEVPLPDESPDQELPELPVEPERGGDDSVDAMDEPESEEYEEKPDPEWDDATMRFDPPEIEDPSDDPYSRAMADTEWRMALQGREQILT